MGNFSIVTHFLITSAMCIGKTNTIFKSLKHNASVYPFKTSSISKQHFLVMVVLQLFLLNCSKLLSAS